jgi:protein-S-isoprenylcysteine O-methyltransferase Ste14
MEHEGYRTWQRVLVQLLAGIIFVAGIPALLALEGPALDRALQWPGFYAGWPNLLAGGIITAAGAFLGGWSVYLQFTLGRGTPIPAMPPRNLLECAPYRYCRNPMTLGTVTAYLGVAVLAGSPAAAAIVILFGVLLSLYNRLWEERELARRYGAPYLAYRDRTPFLIPRRPRRG